MNQARAAMPLISIVILNYKRKEALELVLDSAAQQQYPRREVIVVDNHSEEDVAATVAAHCPEARLIELSCNQGACGGRNAGIAAAHGDIIITLDNDIYFASPLELTKVAAKFAQRPDIHVLAFQLCEAHSDAIRIREWCHARSWKDFAQEEFETHFFVEGAVAQRREVFEAAGAYYEPLFIGVEGFDLALRFLDHGFRILYCPTIRARHLMSSGGRTRWRPYYFYTRNYIWIAYKDYRFFPGMRFLVPKLAMMLYFSLRSRQMLPFLRGLRDGVKGLGRIRADRTPIARQTVQYVAELDKWRPGLLFRLARHRAEPQI